MACKRLGISRKTFYKWRRRFKEAKGNPNALLNRPRRPYRSPGQIKKGMAGKIISLRQKTNLGPLRLWDTLKRHTRLRVIQIHEELAFRRWLFHYNHTRPHMALGGKSQCAAINKLPRKCQHYFPPKPQR